MDTVPYPIINETRPTPAEAADQLLHRAAATLTPAPSTTESCADVEHTYVTVHLADGRLVDVFATGTVQVYSPDLHHAYEFRLPGVPLTASNPPVPLIPLA